MTRSLTQHGRLGGHQIAGVLASLLLPVRDFRRAPYGVLNFLNETGDRNDCVGLPAHEIGPGTGRASLLGVAYSNRLTEARLTKEMERKRG